MENRLNRKMWLTLQMWKKPIKIKRSNLLIARLLTNKLNYSNLKILKFRYENLSEVIVNFYPVDLEVIFSKNPFILQSS